MSRPRVSLTIPPETAELDYWGRDISGEWWALVVWSVQATPPDGTHPVPVWLAGWVLGQCVEQPLRPVEYLGFAGCSSAPNQPSGRRLSTGRARTVVATTSACSTAGAATTG